MRQLVCTNLDWEKLIFVWANKGHVSYPWCQSPTLGCLIPGSPSDLRHQGDLAPGLTSRESCPFWALLQPCSSVCPPAELAQMWGCAPLPSPGCLSVRGAAGGHIGAQCDVLGQVWPCSRGSFHHSLWCCSSQCLCPLSPQQRSLVFFSKTPACSYNTDCCDQRSRSDWRDHWLSLFLLRQDATSQILWGCHNEMRASKLRQATTEIGMQIPTRI